jgi:tetratricopeptide (TPR) repeat protein
MRVLARLLLILVIAGAAVLAHAEGGGDNKPEGPTVSRQTYDTLTAAQEMIGKDQHGAAAEKVRALLPAVEDNAYEAALAWQMLGYALSGAGDYAGAARAFQEALKREALPAAANHDLTLNVAQLLIHGEQYKEGLRYLKQWLGAEPKPSREVRTLAAIAHYRSGDCAGAIPYVRSLVKEQKTPEEQWYQVLLGCHFELKQYDAVAEVLEQLLEMNPDNREYWVQLAAIQQQLGRDEKALALLELAGQRGLLDAGEALNLARMYLAAGTPLKAAAWLEARLADGALSRGRDSLELLADSWLMALERDKGIKALEELARLDGRGETFFRIGRSYFEMERWSPASDALRTALKAGNLTDPALTYLLLGIAAVHVGDRAAAEESLNRAMDDTATRAQAAWWLQRLHSEDAPGEGVPAGGNEG